MKADRYNELMNAFDKPLSSDEIRNNWHWCMDFDGLLMQADKDFYNPVTQCCICGYHFPIPIEQQTDIR